MDFAQIVANANVSVFREPRGFIKILQVILAIFAFATTTSHFSSSKFSVECAKGDVRQHEVFFSYPYRVSHDSRNKIKLPLCRKEGQQPNSTFTPFVSSSSSAEFYVFVGVMAFLYTIAATIMYVVFDDKYRKYDNIPIVDFIVTAVFCLFWLISSSAWASGVADLKFYMTPEHWWAKLDHLKECTNGAITCTTMSSGYYASLNVSIIFGFLNMFVWGGNLWFLFKETKWFKVQAAPPDLPTPVTPTEFPAPQMA